MSVRRGLFRLWVVSSILFVVGVGAFAAGDWTRLVKREFDAASAKKIVLIEPVAKSTSNPFDQFDAPAATKRPAFPAGSILMVPVNCETARGINGKDYMISTTDSLCWYQLPALRKLYAEYNNLEDDELSRRFYATASPKAYVDPKPWLLVSKILAFMIGVPLGVLALGASLMWAIAGFYKARKPG